jgi:hypothetical protein
VVFNAGGIEFVVVNLQYRTGASAVTMDWARSVFEAYPDAFGILNTHYLINGEAAWGAYGKSIYESLSDVANLQLMTCGHISNESRRSDPADDGHMIHTMLADYQSRENGGNGFMRIWEFSPQNNQLTVRSYSPELDKWETDGNSEFTLEVDLRGSGAKFEKLATLDPAKAKATAKAADLMPGTTYEWYATVSDCAHQVTTPIQRFVVAP